MASILIVDDEVDICNVMKDFLEVKFDIKVDVANNGLDAFILCQRNQYSLICTDHRMPMMTGAELINAIRTRENKCQKTPIILISAFVEESKEKFTHSVENVYFMDKPVPLEKLLLQVKIYARIDVRK